MRRRAAAPPTEVIMTKTKNSTTAHQWLNLPFEWDSAAVEEVGLHETAQLEKSTTIQCDMESRSQTDVRRIQFRSVHFSLTLWSRGAPRRISLGWRNLRSTVDIVRTTYMYMSQRWVWEHRETCDAYSLDYLSQKVTDCFIDSGLMWRAVAHSRTLEPGSVHISQPVNWLGYRDTALQRRLTRDLREREREREKERERRTNAGTRAMCFQYPSPLTNWGKTVR